ncbi:MAG: PD-(D/E)XK nuclease family protein, partial [Nitrosomonas sp.]|nr:PD-(D/E)XK nuclease family protein [Nitrosomonas sp.]
LAHEKKRGSFTVAAIEEKYVINIGGLQLNTRLDRVDQLGDGSMIIIDYKTQKQSIASLLGHRLDEPQLPLYLVTAKSDAIAVVFAQVKMGSIGFVGVMRDEELLPGMKAYTELSRYDMADSWEELVEVWRQDLTKLATGFLNGDAKADPKSPLTCRYCDLQSFCRIYERRSDSEKSSVGRMMSE